MAIRNQPLFAAPSAPELKLSQHLAGLKLGPTEKVTYSAYRVTSKRVQCDECVWVLHEAGGVGWSMNGATVSRKRESGGRMLLCSGHAQLWKRRDGVSLTPKRAAGRRR